MIDVRTALPLSVSYIEFETATSLASRLARRNGAPSLRAFCADMGIDLAHLKAGHPVEVGRLALLAGFDPAKLRAATPERESATRLKFHGQRLKFTAFTRSRVRVCPLCIRSEPNTDQHRPFHNGIWQLSSIKSCTIHHCILVEIPPPKHGKQTFDFSRLLDAFRAPPPEFVDPIHQSLERHLISRLREGRQGSWLDHLAFHVVAQLCENFGALLMFGPDYNRAKKSEQQWLEAGAVGYNVLRRGKKAWFRSLKRLQSNSAPQKMTYGSLYRNFLRWLQGRANDPSFDPVRRILSEFIWSNFPVSKGALVLGIPCPEQTIYSISSGADEFGIKQRMLKHQLLKRGYAKQEPNSKRFILMKYPSSELLFQIAQETSRYIGGREAAEMLGVDYNVLRKLVVAGLVRREGLLARNAPYFDPRDVEEFLKRLRQQLDRGEELRGDEMSLTEATLPCQCSTNELVRMILNHNIPLVSANEGAKKLPDLLVSISWLKQCIGTTTSGALTLSESAEILKLDTTTVSNLMSDGFLTPALTKGRSSQRWKVVDAASVAEFGKVYVSAKTLAADLQRDVSNMCMELYRQGVEPLAINGRNRIVFRRRDLH